MPNHCDDKTVGADMTAGYEFPAFFSGFQPFRQEVRKGRPVFNINWVAWILVWGILLLPCCGLAGDEPAPEIMSGFSWDRTSDVTGWWVSEKLDGVRGIWTGTEMLSRSGRTINLPGWFTDSFPDFALDGELWIGRGRFHETAGIVHQIDAGDAWRKVTYCIFDVPHDIKPFEQRIAMAAVWFQKHPSGHVRIVEQTRCPSNAALLALLDKTEKNGGEGLMIRRPGSLYARGRSRDILKMKSFHDTEAVVVGHIAGKGKHRGRLGSLLVELPSGIRFKIGTGFTDRQREDPPPVGSTITFKYKERNPSGIPRFASFLRVREEF